MTDTQYEAWKKISECRKEILAMPRFKGQAQVVKALMRVQSLALWERYKRESDCPYRSGL